MKHVVRLTGLMVVLALVASPAMAQGLQWQDKGFVNVNFVSQTHANTTVTTSSTSTVYDETATMSSAQTIKSSGTSFDVGGGVKVWKNLAIGAAYTRFKSTGGAAISAKVPHPLFYDQPRTANASADALEHQEQQIHFFTMWVVPVSEKLHVGVFGGPSMFSLKQQTIGGASYKEVGSPYTQITLNYTQAETTKSQFGFNVGADVSYKITKMFGVGGFVRYATAKVSISPAGSAISVTCGGLQVGGGARIYF